MDGSSPLLISDSDDCDFDLESNDNVEEAASFNANTDVPGSSSQLVVISDSDDSDFDWESNDNVEEAASFNANTDVPGSSSQAGQSASLVEQYMEFGFAKEVILKAIKDNGDNRQETMLHLCIKYQAQRDCPCDVSDDDDDWNDFEPSGGRTSVASPLDSSTKEPCQNLNKVHTLVGMGFSENQADLAIATCGKDASIADLVTLIVDESQTMFGVEDNSYGGRTRRERYGSQAQGTRGPLLGGIFERDQSSRPVDRLLNPDAIGPPFFYYENSDHAQKGVWSIITEHLYGIEPEYVDSAAFCACTRKRRCIHNLAVEKRSCLTPELPKTIQDALPYTKRWWPSWDPRRKFNTFQTRHCGSGVWTGISETLSKNPDPPPPEIRKQVLETCSHWNLVWVGKNRVAKLEPKEVEFVLGFPEDHTRGFPVRTRHRALASAFQVDSVAYYLSPLKDMYPQGIKVLSLFSGIGGAEVALYRLGIPMKAVISVEKCKDRRTMLKTWWEETQTGNLIEVDDVLSHRLIEKHVRDLDGVDLVIGGSPWTELDTKGLSGEQSSLFYEYASILKSVRAICMQRR